MKERKKSCVKGTEEEQLYMRQLIEETKQK